MAEASHTYENQVIWEKERRGKSETTGRDSLAVGAPPEFGGTGEVWSPEHLTVAAVNACVMLTFIAIAGNSKVPFTAYTAQASGTLEKSEGQMVFTRVTVRPRITVPAGTDPAKVERIVRMAEKNCFISNSLKATVSVTPEVVSAG